MFLNPTLVQLVQSCLKENVQSLKDSIYNFPLEEFFYEVLKSDAQVNNRFYLLKYLPDAIRQYCDIHSECKVTEEILIEEGWIAPFVNRWDFTVWIEESILVEEPLSDELRQRVELLCWLKEQRYNCGEIAVSNFKDTLKRFKDKFAQMPELDWFTKNRLLSDDYNYLQCSWQSGHTAMVAALARLWIHDVDSLDQEQVANWLSLAEVLDPYNETFALLPYNERKILLKILLEQLQAGTIPSVQNENKRIIRSELWYRSHRLKLNATYEPLKNDVVYNLVAFQRCYWEWVRRLYCRQQTTTFYLRPICRHLDLLDAGQFEEAANVIAKFAEIGSLTDMQLEAKDILHLCEHPKTSLFACDRLFASVKDNTYVQKEVLCEAFDQIIKDVIFDKRNYALMPENEELTSLLRYLWQRPEREIYDRQRQKCMGSIISALRKKRHLFNKQLTYIPQRIADIMEQVDDSVAWARDFSLLCLIMDGIYYRGDNRISGEEESFETLQNVIFKKYITLFHEENNKRPSFVKSFCLEYSFWNDIYQSKKKLLCELAEFLQPEIFKDAEKKNDLEMRYCCKIHLTLLVNLMTSNSDEDNILKPIFIDMIFKVMHSKNKLLNYNNMVVLDAVELVYEAIGLVKKADTSFSSFIEELAQYELPELVVILHGAKDEDLKGICYRIIEDKVKVKNANIEVFGYETLVQIVLDEEIIPLYDLVEQMLENYLIRTEGRISIEKQRNWAFHQINRIWLQQKNYPKIIEKGNLFCQAIVYLDSPADRNIGEAKRIWKELLSKDHIPAYYINLIYAYVLEYEEAQKAGEEQACRKILEEVENLRECAEDETFEKWQENEKIRYAVNIHALYVQSGKSARSVVSMLSAELKIDTTVFDEFEKEQQIEQIQVEPSGSVLEALRTYVSAPLSRKSEWFTQMKMCMNAEDTTRTLILWCVMNVCSHLDAYGTQLVVDGKINEDRCNQLFRELFNQAYPEMFGLTANDQEQTGPTGHTMKDRRAGTAEVDITIKNNGNRIAIIEALVLTSLDKKIINEHIHKLIGNNVQYHPMFLFVYGNVADMGSFWRKYKNHICNDFKIETEEEIWTIHRVEEFVESKDYLPELYEEHYFSKQMFRVTMENSYGNECVLYHVVMDIGKKSHSSVAKIGRK